MLNKVKALLDRNEIRDAFDIEFLLRKGISIPKISPEDRKMLREKINSFSINDFKVKLGSLLDSDMRKYYTEKKFLYLLEKI
jgi:hypothetical protein